MPPCQGCRVPVSLQSGLFRGGASTEVVREYRPTGRDARRPRAGSRRRFDPPARPAYVPLACHAPQAGTKFGAIWCRKEARAWTGSFAAACFPAVFRAARSPKRRSGRASTTRCSACWNAACAPCSSRFRVRRRRTRARPKTTWSGRFSNGSAGRPPCASRTCRARTCRTACCSRTARRRRAPPASAPNGSVTRSAPRSSSASAGTCRSTAVPKAGRGRPRPPLRYCAICGGPTISPKAGSAGESCPTGRAGVSISPARARFRNSSSRSISPRC